jgi:hypothetical protein
LSSLPTSRQSPQPSQGSQQQEQQEQQEQQQQQQRGGVMARQSNEMEDVFARAVRGREVSVAECAALQGALAGARELPPVCEKLLQAAGASGLLARRNSSVGRVWKMGEHGKNRIGRTEVVAGGATDSVANPAEEASVADMYLANLDPGAQDKVRRMQARAASQGAKPRVPGSFEVWTGREENQVAVQYEVRKELVRQASRRGEMKQADI